MFIRPSLDYGDIVYNKSNNEAFIMASLLKMDCPHANFSHKSHTPIGIRLITRLHLGLSHLNEHNFRHNFADCVNPLCYCSIKAETTFHFFLHCHTTS